MSAALQAELYDRWERTDKAARKQTTAVGISGVGNDSEVEEEVQCSGVGVRPR